MKYPHFDDYRRGPDGYVAVFAAPEGRATIFIPMEERPGLSKEAQAAEAKEAAAKAKAVAQGLCNYVEEL
jgi:hypothetical protein